jgi:peptide/nickel transport system substrate-binding protein
LLAAAGAGTLAFGLGITGRGMAPASAQGATPVPGGTLRVGIQADPVGLDPHLSVLDAADLVLEFIYEGLVTLGAALEPGPGAAGAWSIAPDGLTYTFTLQDGLTFHNGRAVAASDVKYSLERVQNPDTGSPDAPHVAGIAAIETPDDATVTITLTAPDASFLTRVARTGLAVVPHETVEANGDLQLVTDGTGPFILEEYLPNTHLYFRRNDGYWNAGYPLIDRLELLVVPNDTARTAALASGTVDMIEQAPHKDIESIESIDELTVVGGLTTNLRWLVFNLQREPFGDLALRKAIAQGIDRQPIIDAAVFGYGTPLLGLYPAEFWFGYQGEPPAPDPDGATAAIAALELPEDFRPKLLTFADYDFLANSSVVVQEQLRQLGIATEIDPQETATYIENLFSGNFDLAVMGASGYTDPSEFLTSMLRTGEYTNPGQYSSPSLDELLRQGIERQDPAERAPIYQEAQQIVIDEAPVIPLFTSQTFEGLNRDVQGFSHWLTGRLTGIRYAWLDR